MAEIRNKDFDSLEIFDGKLKEIKHYHLHPEMLPFVGRHYQRTRILILGESHYLSEEETKETKQMLDWYKKSTNDFSFKHRGYFHTRGVVNSYLIGWRSKAHTMFSNPANALIESWDLVDVNNSEAFTAFAFFNYFQRPSAQFGETIELEKKDEEESAKILDLVLKILDPCKVIFLSKKAYDSYIEYKKSVDRELIYYVVHPTCPHWYKADGCEKLIRIFSDVEHRCDFKSNKPLESKKLERIMNDTSYRIIQKRQRRFNEDYVTCRIYTDGVNQDIVNEVAWYIMDEGKKYGIGYVANTGFLWVWDYEYEWYLTDSDLKKSVKLEKLYNEVYHLIEMF